tara:strand:+ start:253 stop:957 length:705 start_codon:yes stop_codon:yes gene_type:complete
MVGVTSKKWASLKSAIMGFWTETDEGWQQDRLTFERQRVRVLMDQKSAAGKASARAKSRKTKKPPQTGVPTDVATGATAKSEQPEPTPDVEEKGKPSSSQEAEDYQRYLKAHPKPVASDAGEAFFSALLADGVEADRIIAAAVAYAETVKTWSREAKVQQSDNFLCPDRGQWKKHHPKPQAVRSSEADVLAFWAEKINGNGFIAASSINAGTARALLSAGLVTPEKLKERGIAA